MMAQNCPTLDKIWTVGVNCEMYQNIKWNRDDFQVWWEVGREIKKFPEAMDKVIQITEDSRHLDPDDYPKMDFIFIDGNHNEEFVVNDTIKALQMVRKGGIIFWHDWNFQEVKNVLGVFSLALDIINVEKENSCFYIHK
jgi:predicted O-methyltransferase YrrM